MEEVLNYAHAHAAGIRKLTEAADSASLIGTKLSLHAELERARELVEILLGEITEEKHPVDGHTMHRRVDVKKPERMAEYGTFKPTHIERVPSAYYVPADLTDALDRLRAHGIRMSSLGGGEKVQVEEFQIQGSEVAANEFQKHRERSLTGTWVAAERQLPKGTLKIDMTQPLARLAFYLIEPRSDDGLVNWNLLDTALTDAKVFPIVRTRQ
ncbi:MAG: hypothetical protein LC753_15530 [Acidobacteria bacterium]|nr:hypothetical protein [Acidobacteriota bacterium]